MTLVYLSVCPLTRFLNFWSEPVCSDHFRTLEDKQHWRLVFRRMILLRSNQIVIFFNPRLFVLNARLRSTNKVKNPISLWKIKILMARLRTIFNIVSLTVTHSPLWIVGNNMPKRHLGNFNSSVKICIYAYVCAYTYACIHIHLLRKTTRKTLLPAGPGPT